ncbi:MAG TPA: MFS transporter [Caulobacteraceae bacterium]|nr:MFS transporter [Caulobacteraceae bacterium]
MNNAAAGERASPGDLIEAIEDAPLDSRYWLAFLILSGIFTVDYFDLFVVSFLVPAFAPKWHLTYSETSIILLAAGVGAIVGALAGGTLADRFGRKPILLWCNALCGIATGSLALVPDRNWIIFALLRFVAGLAIGAMAAAAVAMIVERTPRRHRTLVTGLNLVAPSIGILCASLAAGALLETLGWRGLAALGYAPLALVLLIWLFIPESIHWQVSVGRTAPARLAAQTLLRRPLDGLELPPAPARPPAAGLRELYKTRSRFWLVVLLTLGSTTGIYGTYLWAPSILSAIGRTTPGAAAKLFAFVSGAGVLGKAVVALIAHRFGRYPTGVACLGVGVVSLVGAALTGDAMLGATPLILFCFIGVGLSLDGGSSNFYPYAAEVFPVRLASRGAGLAQAGNGIGKILGPISLAVIAGSGDVMRPAATSAAIMPAFLFMAACAAVGLAAMIFVPIETSGRKLAVNG